MADRDSLEMSDDDFLNEPVPTEVVATPAPADEPVVDEVEDEQQAGEEGQVADEANTEVDEPTTPASEPTDPVVNPDPLSEADEPATSDKAGKPAAVKEKKQGTEAEVPAKVEDKPVVETPAIDYKTEYEKLLAPFKANGKDFTIKSVDDAKALMQMGANYSKKMQQLKPHLKLVKSLEQAGLLSEEKINYMIDLMSNAPGAVNKLVKDRGIDPMELDAEKAGEYQAGNHTVSDTAMELDEVLDDLSTSPKIGDLISLVTKEMDHASRTEITKNPVVLRTLDSHMNTGIYDVIMTEMNREIVLGRLKNVPFLKAYEQVGDALQAAGGFDHLFQGSTPKQAEPAKPKVVEPPKPTKAQEDALNAKRRAASSNRPVVANTGNSKAKEFDPLSMSDADFAKLGL
jgi:hypothetical protein